MYQALIENRGDTQFHATTRHATFVLDTEGHGAHPVDTLLASLCSCLGHYVRDYLVANGIAHRGFSLAAAAGVAPDKISLGDISVSIDLREVSLPPRQTAELLTFVEKCKVHRILTGNPGVVITIAGH
jgi:uncharacterized OsmC-like protein